MWREVERRLGDEATPPVLRPPSPRHRQDRCRPRHPGRVVAFRQGRRPRHCPPLDHVDRFHRKVGLYLHHPEIGADLLGVAGNDPLTIAWAEQHHCRSTSGRSTVTLRTYSTPRMTIEGSVSASRGDQSVRRPMLWRTRVMVAAAISRALSAPTLRRRAVSPGSDSSSR